MKSSVLVGIVVALALLVPATHAAAKVGALKQLPGRAGCVAQQNAPKSLKRGCTVARFGGQQMWDAVVSPDNRNLYVASIGGAISVLRIDTHGHLHQRRGKGGCFSRTGAAGCRVVPALNSSQAIAISRDGLNVYVGSTAPGTGLGGVVVFSRNRKTGALHLIGCVGEDISRGCAVANGLLARVSKIVVSPDGKRVYVGSNSSDPGGAEHGTLAVFARAPGRGLTSSGCQNSDGSLGCRQARALLPECCGLAVSPNSGNVYASSSQIDLVPGTFQSDSGHFALAAFVNGPTGLTQLPGTAGCVNQDGSDGCGAAPFAHPLPVNLAVAVLISPNGRNVYLAHVSYPTDFEVANCDGPDDFIAAFPRNPLEGALSALQQDIRSCGIYPAMSPDGRSIYAATGNFGHVLSLFSRDAQSGRLAHAGCIGVQAKGCRGARHVTAPSVVAVTPSGRYTYVISDDTSFGETIGVFRRSLR